ncbi:uncharacterized protein LOC142334813 [Convolutriloba macropyga]|uniref:uncharacterized protein LOC142334813 n=1 Tax=Convolutriloba macropyga TaxID=536237 RepID=UPI003F51C8B9
MRSAICVHVCFSGAENKQSFIWDRHYRCLLGTLPHNDVVSAVAFNPVDQEMAVTCSDDHTVKVWRSRAQVRRIRRSQAEMRGAERNLFDDEQANCVVAPSILLGQSSSEQSTSCYAGCSTHNIRKTATLVGQKTMTESSESDLVSD